MTDKEKILLEQFKPVTIQDDMMFGTVMADPECCKPFLETILGIKIRKIEYPERQTINNNDEWKVSYMTWAIKLADERRIQGCNTTPWPYPYSSSLFFDRILP